MSDIPQSDAAVQKVQTASTTILSPPQFKEAKKEFPPQAEGAGDLEAQSTTEKANVHDDEEWLENPAHPRNWSSRKKWVNMAIVSKSLHILRSLISHWNSLPHFRFRSTRFYLRLRVR